MRISTWNRWLIDRNTGAARCGCVCGASAAVFADRQRLARAYQARVILKTTTVKAEAKIIAQKLIAKLTITNPDPVPPLSERRGLPAAVAERLAASRFTPHLRSGCAVCPTRYAPCRLRSTRTARQYASHPHHAHPTFSFAGCFVPRAETSVALPQGECY
jgi:hypothetical protein